MIQTTQPKAKISEGFTLTFRAADAMKAGRNAANLDDVRNRRNRPAVYRNRKAYNRRALRSEDRRGE